VQRAERGDRAAIGRHSFFVAGKYLHGDPQQRLHARREGVAIFGAAHGAGCNREEPHVVSAYGAQVRGNRVQRALHRLVAEFSAVPEPFADARADRPREHDVRHRRGDIGKRDAG